MISQEGYGLEVGVISHYFNPMNILILREKSKIT